MTGAAMGTPDPGCHTPIESPVTSGALVVEEIDITPMGASKQQVLTFYSDGTSAVVEHSLDEADEIFRQIELRSLQNWSTPRWFWEFERFGEHLELRP